MGLLFSNLLTKKPYSANPCRHLRLPETRQKISMFFV